MSLALRVEFRRWSRWYPRVWRESNGAAMLGVYLDRAEAEHFDRLGASDKLALVFGGIGARFDLLAPATVRDRVALVMLSLLGAYGVITGVVFEWAPWAMAHRAAIMHGTQLALPGATLEFGPFLTPYAIVACCAMASWILAFVGPAWLYRCALAATAASGLCTAVMAHIGFGDFTWMRATPSAFAVAVALLALPARRPRRGGLLIGTAAWAAFFVATTVVFGPWTIAHFLTGDSAPYEFFAGVAQPMLVFFGTLAAQFVVVLLSLAGLRRAAATVAWAAAVPWAFVAFGAAAWGPAGASLPSLLLIVGFTIVSLDAAVLQPARYTVPAESHQVVPR